MLDLLATIFGGGITGLIGSIANAFVKYKLAKLQYEKELELKKLQLQEIAARAEAEVKIQNAAAFKESYKYLAAPLFKESYFEKLPKFVQIVLGTLFGLVDFLRALIRPVLTISLAGTMLYLIFKTVILADSSNITILLIDKFDALVNTLLYLTITIVAWWFGNRDIEKFFDKQFSNRR